MTKVIRSYNKMAMVLLQYEVLHLQGWSQAAERTPHCLNAALLVRHENNKVLNEGMINERMTQPAVKWLNVDLKTTVVYISV